MRQVIGRTILMAGLALAFTAEAFAATSEQETAVHQLVTAYFGGREALATEAELKTALGDQSVAVAEPLESLAAALGKLQVDGERGLLRFKEPDFVAYARAVAVSDVGVASSALTRVKTGLDAQTLPAAATEQLTSLTTQLSELLTKLGGR